MKTNLNLLPEEIQEKYKKKDNILLVVPVVIIILVFFIFNIFISSNINNYKKNIASFNEEIIQINQEYARLLKDLEDVEKIKDKIVGKKEQLNLINKLFGVKQNVSDFFREISLIIPDKVWLTNFIFDNVNHNISIQGQSFNNDSLQDFLFNLRESSWLSDVELKSTELVVLQRPVINFVINSNIIGKDIK